jgi:hypothetical protein
MEGGCTPPMNLVASLSPRKAQKPAKSSVAGGRRISRSVSSVGPKVPDGFIAFPFFRRPGPGDPCPLPARFLACQPRNMKFPEPPGHESGYVRWSGTNEVPMKTTLTTLIAAGLIGATCLGSAPAMAQSIGLSFRMGDVAFAYSDGYYDHGRRWHPWSWRERNYYRDHYRNYYYRSMRHDEDRDGISDRFDRDRDNDGVPNAYDRRPDNPTRR